MTEQQPLKPGAPQGSLNCSLCERKLTKSSRTDSQGRTCSRLCEDCAEDLKERFESEEQEFETKTTSEEKRSETGENRPSQSKAKRIKQEPLSDEKYQELKRRAQAILESIQRVKSANCHELINMHCDNLELEVMETVESAIQHLNKVQDEFIAEINVYRSRLLEAAPSVCVDGIKETAASIQEISASFETHFTSTYQHPESFMDVSEVQDELQLLEEFEADAKEIQRNIKLSLISVDGKVLRFNENHLFCLSNEILGELAYEPLKMPSNIKSSIDELVEPAFEPLPDIVFPNKRIAVFTHCDFVDVYDERNEELLYELKGHDDDVVDMILLKNGWLATSSLDSTIKIWAGNKRKAIKTLTGHTGAILTMLSLKNGCLATCSEDNTIKIWNPLAWEQKDHLVRTMNCGAQFQANMCSLSNEYLVTCSPRHGSEESVVRVWNPETGKSVRELPTGHRKARHLLVLSNDELAIGFMNGLVRVMSLVDSGRSLTIRAHQDPIHWLYELPNWHIQTCGGPTCLEREYKVWRLDNGQFVKNL